MLSNSSVRKEHNSERLCSCGEAGCSQLKCPIPCTRTVASPSRGQTRKANGNCPTACKGQNHKCHSTGSARSRGGHYPKGRGQLILLLNISCTVQAPHSQVFTLCQGGGHSEKRVEVPHAPCFPIQSVPPPTGMEIFLSLLSSFAAQVEAAAGLHLFKCLGSALAHLQKPSKHPGAPSPASVAHTSPL